MLCSSISACAAWRGADLARERRDADKDHAACVAAGREFPGADYTACRLAAAETRAQRQWLELTLNQRMAASRDTELVRTPPSAPYRPIDSARFRCETRGQEAETWIACREQ